MIEKPVTLSSRPLQSLLQAIAGGDALARGCVNVIGVEALRRSIGARWEMRREHIWDHIQKTLEGRLSPNDAVERIGEVEFLVFVAAENGPVAQTVCLRALQEILVHYLGAFEMADLTIKTVTAVHGSALSCVELDPAAVLRATAADAPSRKAPLAEAERKGAASAMDFMAKVRGHDLHFHVEEMISLRHDALAGGRIRRSITPAGAARSLTRGQLGGLDTATLAAIDIQTVRFAASLLRGESSFAYPSLTVPSGLQTLGHSTARAGYLQALRTLPAEDSRRLLVELINLDEGTPACRVGEAVSALRGVCRGVSAFTDPTRRAIAVLKNNRLMSIVANARQLAVAGGDMDAAIARFAEAAREVAPTTALRGALQPSEMDAAREAGVTYVINPVDSSRLRAAAA